MSDTRERRLRDIAERLARAQASNVYRGDYRGDMAFLLGVIEETKTADPSPIAPVVQPTPETRTRRTVDSAKACSICGNDAGRGSICADCAVCGCGSGKPPGLCHGTSRRDALRKKGRRTVTA